MNEKLQLVGLLFLYDNINYADTIIKMMNRRDAGLNISMISIINSIKKRMKFRELWKEE